MSLNSEISLYLWKLFFWSCLLYLLGVDNSTASQNTPVLCSILSDHCLYGSFLSVFIVPTRMELMKCENGITLPRPEIVGQTYTLQTENVYIYGNLICELSFLGTFYGSRFSRVVCSRKPSVFNIDIYMNIARQVGTESKVVCLDSMTLVVSHNQCINHQEDNS